MKIGLQTKALGRSFPAWIRAWDGPNLVGFVDRPTWREVRLRGTVPIVLTLQGRQTWADLREAGEHHLHISRIGLTRNELDLPDYSDHEAAFSIDWDRAVPERMAAAIFSDPLHLDRWRRLSYPDACDLISPVRRAISPRSIALREAAALEDLRAGRPGAPR